MERITQAELVRRCSGQGVSSPNHWAFRCVICGTVQSGASLHAAGVDWDRAKSIIGFSCEGRLKDAGPWPNAEDRSAKAKARRKVRGCDWTLGGLFTIHNLEVMIPGDGGERARPCFPIATAEEAQALEQLMRDQS